MHRIAVALLFVVSFVQAQTDEPARPAAPDIEWVTGETEVVTLPPAAAAKLVPAHVVPGTPDGRFLFGPTSGFDVRAGGGGLILQPRPEGDSGLEPITVKAGRRTFGFVYGSGEAV